MSWPNSITIHPMNYFCECRLLMLKSQCSVWIATITYIICLFTLSICMYIPNLSVVCFFICLSYFIFDCALLLFCAQAWHGKTWSSRNDPIFFCSLHWRNLSLYNKITTTHFKQIRFWWKYVIKFRGKVYSNFFKFVQQLFFLSVGETLGNVSQGKTRLRTGWVFVCCFYVSERMRCRCGEAIRVDEWMVTAVWLV